MQKKLSKYKKKSLRAFSFVLNHKKITFISLLRPYLLPLFFGCVLLLFTNLAMIALPLLLNGGVSLIEKSKPFMLDVVFFRFEFLDIYMVLWVVIVLAIAGAILRTLSRMMLFNVGRMIERDTRAKIFFHLSTLDDGFFSRHLVGDLMNHLTTDVSNTRMVTGFAALNIVNIIFVFCFTVPLLFRVDIFLATCALLPFPLIIIATRSISKKMFQETISYQEQLSYMVNHIQENLLGAHVVRLFHQQEKEAERFEYTNKKTYHAGVKLARVRMLMMPVMRLMVGVAVGLVLYVGGGAVLSGRISLGDFVEVNTRLLQLSWPAMSVGFVLSVYSRGKASLKRINNLLSLIPEIKDGEKNISSLHKIDVHDVSLTKSLAKKDRISFSIKQGEMIGIVGPSGSYKTTLLRMIYRRQQSFPGTIFFDGHDSHDLSLSSIYQHISVVPQETFLFHKSIRDNICFAVAHASEKDVHEVLALTRLDRDFSTLSKGLDTIVGERGVTLSGGQKQRVALARALLAKRSVIILDDALSSVDAATEQHIISKLRDYVPTSMIIMATHRLSALKEADMILVMDDGKIVASGVHDDLIHTCKLYQQLLGLDELKGRLS